jgi:GTP:adenosylcobinamide-phosphate guanylyltransferase
MSAKGAPSIPAIIMAGGRESDKFAAAGENPVRGLAEIHGSPMVAYVVNALRASPSVSRIAIVCAAGFPQSGNVDRVIEARGGMVENVRAGLEACRDLGEAVLLTSADVPFLTGAAIEDFLLRSLNSGAALGYAVVPRGASEARFPHMRRTYARLAEGEFTGGNAFFLRHDAWPAIERVLSRVHGARKKPWILAQFLGVRILWRYLRHTVTVHEAEERISHLLGAPCRAIITQYAELGADVDDPAELAIARELLRPLRC